MPNRTWKFFGYLMGKRAGDPPPEGALSRMWRCTYCGAVQIFDSPSAAPVSCKYCGSREFEVVDPH